MRNRLLSSKIRRLLLSGAVGIAVTVIIAMATTWHYYILIRDLHGFGMTVGEAVKRYFTLYLVFAVSLSVSLIILQAVLEWIPRQIGLLNVFPVFLLLLFGHMIIVSLIYYCLFEILIPHLSWIHAGYHWSMKWLILAAGILNIFIAHYKTINIPPPQSA